MQTRKSKANWFASNLFRQIKFFVELEREQGREAVQDCLARLRVENHHKDSVVFRIGDYGDRYYIILEGEVSVLIPIEQEGHTELISINTLHQGQCFGEFALVNDKPRMATIRCATDCVFAVLLRKDYKLILQKKHSQKLTQITHQMSKVAGFQNFNNKGLTMLYMSSKPIELQKRDILYQRDEPSEHIYMVVFGDFRLQVRSENRIRNVSIVGEFELLGEFEALSDLPYAFTAECESDFARVLAIKKSKFVSILQANYLGDQLEELLRQAQFKHETRLKQLSVQIRQPSMKVRTDMIESTRTIYYSEKQNTYLSDTILVQANRQVINNILSRGALARPVINIRQPRRKAKLDSNFKMRPLSLTLRLVQQHKDNIRSLSLLL